MPMTGATEAKKRKKKRMEKAKPTKTTTTPVKEKEDEDCRLDDEGDLNAYPREGRCLFYDATNRPRPAWVCAVREQDDDGIRRVVVYGESTGAGRLLDPETERIEGWPKGGDVELAARLQNEWSSSPPPERDELLRSLDEMEARLIAPPGFIKMLHWLKASGNLCSASIGREFYPNLFAPRVGDSVRVLWDNEWYEATAATRKLDSRHSDVLNAVTQRREGVEIACEACYGRRHAVRADGDEDDLKGVLALEYCPDGCFDEMRWPDPEHEAFLVAPQLRQPRRLRPLSTESFAALHQHRRRCSARSLDSALRRDWRALVSKSRDGNFELQAQFASQCLPVLVPLVPVILVQSTKTKPGPLTARQKPGSKKAAVVKPDEEMPEEKKQEIVVDAPIDVKKLPAFLDAVAELKQPRRRGDDSDSSSSEEESEDDEEEDETHLKEKVLACIKALKAVSRPLAALMADFDPNGSVRPSSSSSKDAPDWPWGWADDETDAPLNALHNMAKALAPFCDFTGLTPTGELLNSSLANLALWGSKGKSPTAADVATLCRAVDEVVSTWNEDAASELLGPKDPAVFEGCPSFAMLPQTRVPEPHRTWIRRAKNAAEGHNRNLESAKVVVQPSSDDEESSRSSTSSGSSSRTSRRRRYSSRPTPGSAQAAFGSDRGELLMERLSRPVSSAIAKGLKLTDDVDDLQIAAKCSLVTVSAAGPLKGEQGVVAHTKILKRSAVPYSGVICTDQELALLIRRKPRATARLLMYRYEFGEGLSVLPYLGCPTHSMAPFINCARGPSAIELLCARGFTDEIVEEEVEEPRSKRGRPVTKEEEKKKEKKKLPPQWRAWGSKHIGLRVRRTVFGEDDTSVAGRADGTVVAFLDAKESQFKNKQGVQAALWRVRYDDDGLLTGDFEDLELHELLESAKAPQLALDALKAWNLDNDEEQGSDDSSSSDSGGSDSESDSEEEAETVTTAKRAAKQNKAKGMLKPKAGAKSADMPAPLPATGRGAKRPRPVGAKVASVGAKQQAKSKTGPKKATASDDEAPASPSKSKKTAATSPKKKKKAAATDDEEAASPSKSKKAAASPSKKKKKKKATAADDEEAPPSKSKKAAASPSKKKKKKKAAAAEDEEPASPSKSKKTAAEKKKTAAAEDEEASPSKSKKTGGSKKKDTADDEGAPVSPSKSKKAAASPPKKKKKKGSEETLTVTLSPSKSKKAAAAEKKKKATEEKEEEAAVSPKKSKTKKKKHRTQSGSSNCQFYEVTADEGAVVGVFVIASRTIEAGESLLVKYGREFWAGWSQRKARLHELETCAETLISASLSLKEAVGRLDEAKKVWERSRKRVSSNQNAWKSLVGVPFVSKTRPSRGFAKKQTEAVVCCLAAEPPSAEVVSKITENWAPSVGERVEGFWNGASPSWPCIVQGISVGVSNKITLDMEYDDGGRERHNLLCSLRPRRKPSEWRAIEKIEPGTWVRKVVKRDEALCSCGAALSPLLSPSSAPNVMCRACRETADEKPKKKSKKHKRDYAKMTQNNKQASKQDEGILLKWESGGTFEVICDDGSTQRRCSPEEWEPLMLVRYSDSHDQRVLSLDQLRAWKPCFLQDSSENEFETLTEFLVDAGVPEPVLVTDETEAAEELSL